MYLWLKDGADEKLRDPKSPVFLGGDNELGKLQIENDWKSGRKYIRIYDDETDDVYPKLLKLTRKVTLHETIHSGFVPDGIYRLGKATVVVKTKKVVHSEMNDYAVEVDVTQQLRFSAPSPRALRRIYTLLRQHELEPTEKWAEAPREQLYATTSDPLDDPLNDPA